MANQWQFSGKSVANQWQISGKLVRTVFPRTMRKEQMMNPEGLTCFNTRIARGNIVIANLPLICH